MAMKKFVRRFSSASLDLPNVRKDSRDRSASELVSPSELAGHPRTNLEYLGYTYVKDPHSIREIHTAIRTVRQTSLSRNHWVNLSVKSGMLTVYETTGETLIMSSVACIAQCVCELSRALSECLAITFSAGHNSKQCHVFQARSSREASNVVHQIQKANKISHKSRSKGVGDKGLSSPQQLGESSKLGLHLMEDEEGEIIEHKPISLSLSRNESKKMVFRPPSTDYNSSSYIDSFPPYGKFSSTSMGFMTTPPKGKRRMAANKAGRQREERTFTQEDKVAQILSAAEKVREKNAQLRSVASKRTPSSPFEDALYAMHVANTDLLRNYIQSGHIHVDASDSEGNSLLHYAAAIGNVNATKIICQFISPSMIDAQGWNKCTATHRAVADGNISILRVLLSQNANVNIADLMRRTPLHLTSVRKELMECSIALLEAGAQIMTADILGLRPYDLRPDLKEFQSRLVMSACDLFSTSAPSSHASGKGHTLSVTPTTLSPMSTRPSSFTSDLARSINSAAITTSHEMSHDISHDILKPHPLQQHCSLSPATVAGANARVHQWMRTMSRQNRYRKLVTRSMTNLCELRDEEEEEMSRRTRMEMLKFPSDFNINTAYYELEETADDVMKNIDELISVSKKAESPGGGSGDEVRGRVILRRQRSLSEPSLGAEDDVSVDTPPLHGSIPQSPLLGAKVMEMRPESVTSHSSAGTVVKPGEDEGLRKMSEAFDRLEDDLWGGEREGGGGRWRRRELARMSLPASLMDSRRGGPPSPLLLQTRTVSETDAIFDEILSQIKDASRVLDGRVESPDYDRLPPKLPTIPLKGGREFSSRGASLDERLGQMDLPRRRLHTSCSSSSDIDGPGALMRRLSGRRKPPFLEEMLAGRHSPSSEVSEKLAWRPPHGRKFLAPDRKSSPVPNILTSSGSDSFPLSATSAHVNFDLLHQLSVLPDKPRLSACSDEFSDVAVSDLEPATKALKLMVCVSRNKECLSTLVSYLCLPKFMDKIATLAKCPVTPPKALGYIATLLTNIFEVGGSDGRKTAMGSGFLELIIKLLHTRDPIPGTCLSLLNNLLASDDDNDHLQKIIRVPSEPLLMYLEPIEMSGSDADSGIGSRHLSRITPSGSDNQMYSSDSSRPNSGIGAGGSHLDFRLPPGGLGGPSSPSGSRPGTGSFVSDISDSTSALSLVSPTLKGPPISLTDARCIVLKMLSVSSCHRKMQRGLAKPHSVTLLSGCLGDVSQENVTNAVITLANMAQNVDSHNMLREAGIVAKLQDLLGNDPRQSFHVTRGLVYMGELALPANNLFSESGSSWEADFVVLSRDEDDGHSYARGATIEKCVEFLTESVSHLWGGFSLKSGPHSPGNELAKRATKQQIATFFLTCYQSFMHPLILIRLLLHRLAMPCSQNPFDWSVNPDKGSVPSFAHTDSIPAHQSATLKVIGRWLEDFSDDFVQHLELNEEVSKIVQRLKLARGPYTTHCHRLRSLQHDVTRPRSNTLRTRQRLERLPPHHSNLYTMLKKVILTGLLPVTLDEAIYLTALQMHIEMVAEPSPFIGRPSVRGNSGLHRSPSKVKKSFTGKLKSTLPSGYTKSKPLMKRVRALMQDVEMLSERNSKHSFIERCQALPGYECTLYPVRVPQGARFRKEAKQILGVGSKKIVFLDEKTKELVSSYSMEQIGSVSVEEDPCSLVLVPVEGGPVRFHVETSRMAWDIKNMIQRGKDGEDVQPVEEVVRWSESTSMASSTTPPSIPPPSPSRSSSTSSDDNPSSRETSPSPSSDKPTPQETDVGPQGTTSGPKTTTISPGVVPTLTNSSPAHVQNGHVRSDSYDITEQSACEENRSVSFCNCPPDPEIPRHIKLYQLSVGDVLKCPLEIARQMTLIAHEHFGRISSIELLQKVHLIPKTKSPSLPSSLPPSYTTSLPRPSKRAHIQQLEIDTRPQTAVERLAYRFNQVGNWVASTILTFDELEQRVDALEQFILIAKHCLDLRNYSSMMAIIMAGLGSAPIRRLHRTWEGVSKVHMEMFKQMDTILESKSNYKNYRDKLSITPVPAVPYIGVFLKDLTFIADGNPDYIRGGLVNLHKRRQVYQKLEEITHFQQEHYNYHTVPELQAYLLGFHPIPDEELHSKSNILEPRIRRSQSHNSTRAKSTSSSTSSFFKALTRSTSSSSTNLHRTS